jgi:predicted Zn finger-like uncharacterized protein
MRLICPNCDAQYEVPDQVIPTSGRDVQCSNCGQTWFQHHPDHLPEDEENDADGVAPDLPDPDEETSPPPSASVTPPGPAPGKEPPRRELDPSVADILRQEAEAEQEARQRQRQRETLESQPDLGLPPAERRPAVADQPAHDLDDEDEEDSAERTRVARERMARMRGEPSWMSEEDANAAAISSRRDLLPDIEEINSTLRSSDARSGAGVDPGAEVQTTVAQQQRRGFRNGFLVVFCIAALLSLIYIFAREIAVTAPQTDPYLSAYVAQVDQARFWLDGQVEGMLRWLDALATESAG